MSDAVTGNRRAVANVLAATPTSRGARRRALETARSRRPDVASAPATGPTAACVYHGDCTKHRAHRSGSIVRQTCDSARWIRCPPDGQTSV